MCSVCLIYFGQECRSLGTGSVITAVQPYCFHHFPANQTAKISAPIDKMTAPADLFRAGIWICIILCVFSRRHAKARTRRCWRSTLRDQSCCPSSMFQRRTSGITTRSLASRSDLCVLTVNWLETLDSGLHPYHAQYLYIFNVACMRRYCGVHICIFWWAKLWKVPGSTLKERSKAEVPFKKQTLVYACLCSPAVWEWTNMPPLLEPDTERKTRPTMLSVTGHLFHIVAADFIVGGTDDLLVLFSCAM